MFDLLGTTRSNVHTRVDRERRDLTPLLGFLREAPAEIS